VEQVRLVPSDVGPGDHFGRTVAIHGDYAIVGSSRDDDLGNQTGSAYIYRFDGSNWIEQTKLLPSDGAPRDHFGRFVLLSDDHALVASTFADINGVMDAGAVYDYTNYESQAPAPPGLLSPADGDTSVSTHPTLSWTALLGDVSYQVQVSDTVDFSRLTVDDDSIATASFDLTGLSKPVTYYWRVRVTNPFGTSDWSTAWSFTTGPIPCNEIVTFRSRCITGGTIAVKLAIPGTARIGDTLEVTIDSVIHTAVIGANGRANLSTGGFSVGTHTVELTDPDCFDPISVLCRAGLAKEGEFWEDEETLEAPTASILFDNYPNPFNPSTTFRYGLSEPGPVSLRIYNTLGQLVVTAVDAYQNEGYHEIFWDGRNDSGSPVASGIYIYRLTAGGFTATKRMLLLK
jgi:hypothetical protein